MKARTSAALLLLLSLHWLLAACGSREREAVVPLPAAAMAAPALYDRLGGLPAITAVVDEFVANVAANPKINERFAKTDIPKLKKNLVDQVCEASGGPCRYEGKSMVAAHEGMKISQGEFNAMGGDMARALDKLNVPEREKKEVLALLGSMQGDIVGR